MRVSSLNEVRGQPQAASCGRPHGKEWQGAWQRVARLKHWLPAVVHKIMLCLQRCEVWQRQRGHSSFLIGRAFLCFKLDITHTPRATRACLTLSASTPTNWRTDMRDVSLHNQQSLRPSALALLALSGAWEATQLSLLLLSLLLSLPTAR